MAKRKLKGKPREERPQPQYATTKKKKSDTSQNRVYAFLIIGVAAFALIGFAIAGLPSSNQNAGTDATETEEVAPPMTGVETLQAEALDEKTAQKATFKLVELGGTDCVQSFLDKVKETGGIGKIRADYDNTLLEVQFDPKKQSVAKIIQALTESDHPGKVTSEVVGQKKKDATNTSTTNRSPLMQPSN